MPENTEKINCWSAINKEANGSRVRITGKRIDIFDIINKTDLDGNIKEYSFENCCFSEDFILSVDSSIKADFIFKDCSFRTFICQSDHIKGKEYSGVFSFSKTKHQGNIKFQGIFKNRIYIDDSELGDGCSIDFVGSNSKDRTYFYSDIVIFRTNTSMIFQQCEVGNLLIEDSEFIEKLEIKDVSIKNKLSIIGIDKCDLLEINNLDCHEGSKVLFENSALDKLFFTKISQDVKYMQFNNVWVEEKFSCEKVEFKNTYFNEFYIENAKKFISKTSFIDAHLNDVNWGDVSSISADEATFRQLKFVNDSQGSHLIANQFYAMEMLKYKISVDQTSWKDNWQEKVAFWLNSGISNFGQSYGMPIGWIFILISMHSFLVYAHKNDWLYRIFEPLNPLLEGIARPLNSIASSVLPISRFLGKGNGREFIDLLFFIILSILIWHLVVALKRHTKR